MKQVIIDTDMAIDDWFAILYLLQKPEVQILAITVTGTGEAHCEPGVKNALGLIRLAQHTPIPTASGVELPLQGSNVFPDFFRTTVDSVLGIDLLPGSNPTQFGNAVDLLIATLENAQEPLDILALGPLTNLAQLVLARPDLKKKIRKLIIMGGAIHVPGNLLHYIPENKHAEWNIFIDPLAANLVFESGIPILLVGLDATNQTRLTLEFYQQFKNAVTTPEARFVELVMSKMQSFIQSGHWFFWDPLAAAIMLDESFATCEMLPLHVVEEDGNMLGATIVLPGAPHIQVAMSADGTRFAVDFIQTLNNPNL